VIGIVLGIITYFSSDQHEIIEFNTDLFFTVILPPIIMEAGYFMPTRAFFDQLGTILLHAVIATLVGNIVVVLCGSGPRKELPRFLTEGRMSMT